MGQIKDITGKKFGRLLAIKVVGKSKRNTYQWLCKCDCGNEKVVDSSYLIHGSTKSCGCYAKEVKSKNGKIHALEMGKNNKRYNNYDLSGNYGIGYTSKDEEFYFDLEDYDKIKNYCWYWEKKDNNYVMSRVSKNRHLRFHYLIMEDKIKEFLLNNPKKYFEIDHINKKKNDNRKENLRFSNREENSYNSSKNKNNTSGVTGVSWLKKNNKWLSHITIKNKTHRLGLFENFENAVIARLKAEKEYFKDFAPQKHLFKEYKIIG